ncbi:MAG: ribosome maturation factor RimP [Clostridium sp.]|nr:ribosome maturation factor RimP [Clostridium sp.]
MAKASGGVAERVREMALPLANELGLSLWDVRFFKEGADWILLITIDKLGGICIDDCEAMSRAIDPLLDESDLIDASYRLQVSSPGLERRLRTQEQLAAYVGQRVFLRLQSAFEGQKDYRGVLAQAEGKSFTLELPDGRAMCCELRECAWVKADDF